MTPETWWYLARSSGIVAMVLAGLSVLWGIGASGRFLRQRFTKASLVDTHKILGAAALVFTLGHIVSIIMNGHQGFTAADAFVPFRAPFSTSAIAWGICAFYLLVAIEVSSLYMKHIPRRLWRGIHLTSYFVFFAGIYHGAGAGSDAGNPAYAIGAVLFTVAITGMTIARILKSVPSETSARPASTVGPNGTPRARRASTGSESSPRPVAAASVAPANVGGDSASAAASAEFPVVPPGQATFGGTQPDVLWARPVND